VNNSLNSVLSQSSTIQGRMRFTISLQSKATVLYEKRVCSILFLLTSCGSEESQRDLHFFWSSLGFIDQFLMWKMFSFQESISLRTNQMLILLKLIPKKEHYLHPLHLNLLIYFFRVFIAHPWKL
jgi:hypothetical protein